MKKSYLIALFALLLFAACNSNQKAATTEEPVAEEVVTEMDSVSAPDSTVMEVADSVSTDTEVAQ